MKAGDLVKYRHLHGYVTNGKFLSKDWVGIVIGAAKYSESEVVGKPLYSTSTGREMLIMWDHGPEVECEDALEVVSENR